MELLCYFSPRKLKSSLHNSTTPGSSIIREVITIASYGRMRHSLVLTEGRSDYKRTHYLPVTIVNYKTKTPTVYKGLSVCVLTQSASPLIYTTRWTELVSVLYRNQEDLHAFGIDLNRK